MTPRSRACAHSTATQCASASPSRSRASSRPWRRRDLWGAVAREVIEAYGDDTAAHPIGTGPFRLAEWRRSSKIVLVRNPTYRDVRYDCEPNADDAEGQALLAKFKGRTLPMVDRVEVSVIEEQQPRWLSFLQKQQDLLERLPIGVRQSRDPQQPAGAQSRRAGHPDVPDAGLGRDADGLQHGEPGHRRLHAGEDRAAARAEPGDEHRTGDPPRAQGAGDSGASRRWCPTRRASIRTSGARATTRARPRALLDLYGYVDRDGDGWREQPDGSPLLSSKSRRSPTRHRAGSTNCSARTTRRSASRPSSRQAKWPENLRNVRAGKYMVWRVGSSAASPDGQPALDRDRFDPQRRAEPRALQQQAGRRVLRPPERDSGRAGARTSSSARASA